MCEVILGNQDGAAQKENTPYASLLLTYREPQVLKRLLQAAQRFKGLSGMVARENEEISGALKKSRKKSCNESYLRASVKRLYVLSIRLQRVRGVLWIVPGNRMTFRCIPKASR